MGFSITEIAPTLITLIPRLRRSRRLARDAIPGQAWIQNPGWMATLEYVDVWRRLQGISLQPRPDFIRWRWMDSGIYTTKSC